jgi:hypothetical protein
MNNRALAATLGSYGVAIPIGYLLADATGILAGIATVSAIVVIANMED